MRQGRHAAGDGSFGRSAGAAAGRGAALLAVAVLLGVVLLNRMDEAPPGEASTAVRSRSTEGGPTTSSPTTTSSTVAARAPSTVKVLALNASRKDGAARQTTNTLRTAGYSVLAPDTVRNRAAAPTTAVYFTTPDFRADALLVARALALPPAMVQPVPAPPPIPDLRGANLVVVVGLDLANRPAPTSTTTARAGATTTSARQTTTTTTRR